MATKNLERLLSGAGRSKHTVGTSHVARRACVVTVLLPVVIACGGEGPTEPESFPRVAAKEFSNRCSTSGAVQVCASVRVATDTLPDGGTRLSLFLRNLDGLNSADQSASVGGMTTGGVLFTLESYVSLDPAAAEGLTVEVTLEDGAREVGTAYRVLRMGAGDGGADWSAGASMIVGEGEFRTGGVAGCNTPLDDYNGYQTCAGGWVVYSEDFSAVFSAASFELRGLRWLGVNPADLSVLQVSCGYDGPNCVEIAPPS